MAEGYHCPTKPRKKPVTFYPDRFRDGYLGRANHGTPRGYCWIDTKWQPKDMLWFPVQTTSPPSLHSFVTTPNEVEKKTKLRPLNCNDYIAAEPEEAMSALMGSVSTLVGGRLCSSIPSCQRSSSRPQSPHKPSIVVCKADSSSPVDAPPESSRRSVLLGTASVAAAAAAFLNQSDAQAKRKPPPPPEEKRPEDDPNLSALDAKKLANARRKEAMRAMVEGAKAKSKQVQAAVKTPTTMNIESAN